MSGEPESGTPEGGEQPSSPAQSSDERLTALYPDDPPRDDAETPDADDDTSKSAEQKAEVKEPVASEYRLTLPEGVELDQALLGEATPVFRDLGLSSEQASKLVPLAVKVQERFAEAQTDEFTALRADWAKQTKADPSLGGAKWKETEQLAALALNAGGAFPGSEARKLLDEFGLGNHREFVKLFRTIGEKLKGAGVGGSAIETRMNRLKAMYPDD